MPKFTPKTQEQLMAAAIAKLVSRTGLSDVGDSSVMKHLIAAMCRQDAQQYYQMTLLLQLFSIDTATGDDLDQRAKDIQPGTLQRLQASKATGTVVFSRNGTSGSVVIPVGTKVKTGDGKVFSTTTAGSITAASVEQIPGHGVGRDSNLVSVVAEVPGSAGNVVAGTVVKFSSKPAGVDEVTNLSAFANGRDKETDDAFRTRLKAYVGGLARCTIGAMEAWLLGQQDPDTGASIVSVNIFEDPVERGNITVYVDDGTGTAEAVARSWIALTEAMTWNGTLTVTTLIGEEPDFEVGDFIKFLITDPLFEVINIAPQALSGTWSWDGSTTVLTTDTSGVSPGDQIKYGIDGHPFVIDTIVPNTSVAILNPGSELIPSGVGSTYRVGDPMVVTIDNPSAESIPSGTGISYKAGDNVTQGLAGPPPDTAVGGEAVLFLNNPPIKASEAYSLYSSTRGLLVENTDYRLNPATGQVDFLVTLTAGERIVADYTHYVGLIAYAQKLVDGDPNDRINYPGLRAAGVYAIVQTPQVLLQNVTCTITVKEGFDYDEAQAKVRQAIKDYINNLGISGDLIRNRLIEKVMSVDAIYNTIVSVPANDVIILDDQLARTADPNIVIT